MDIKDGEMPDFKSGSEDDFCLWPHREALWPSSGIMRESTCLKECDL